MAWLYFWESPSETWKLAIERLFRGAACETVAMSDSVGRCPATWQTGYRFCRRSEVAERPSFAGGWGCVQAGERVAVIEAIKMGNVLFAAADGMVSKVLAGQGESLSVDQPIVEFSAWD